MFPWVQQNQKSLSLKTNLIENDQIHCLYVRKHEMCFWPNLGTKWKNNLALISMSILFFCFCKHFKKKKRNMSYLPFCNKKISSIFCRIIFSPPYTNYPQYTTYGWIRNEKTTKITTSCSVNRVNKCVCKIQFRTWFLFVLSAASFKIIQPHRMDPHDILSPVSELVSCFKYIQGLPALFYQRCFDTCTPQPNRGSVQV